MNTEFLLGALVGVLPLVAFALVARFFSVRVEDDEAVLVTRFGKLWKDLRRPGFHFTPERLLPYVKLVHVSLQRDFKVLTQVSVNDARGTSVVVELFVEKHVTDPIAATFAVENVEEALDHLIVAAATEVLGNEDFARIVTERVPLGEKVRSEVANEAKRWGVEVERIIISHVKLLPEVARQLFVATAARLERARADIDEGGRLKVARLDAETSAQVAALVAEAKSQYPLAIGASLEKLKQVPEVLEAYRTLYELSLLRPHRTVAFRGFGEDELKAAEALMAVPSSTNSAA